MGVEAQSTEIYAFSSFLRFLVLWSYHRLSVVTGMHQITHGHKNNQRQSHAMDSYHQRKLVGLPLFQVGTEAEAATLTEP